jgi:hypothetical protein
MTPRADEVITAQRETPSLDAKEDEEEDEDPGQETELDEDFEVLVE